MANLFLDGIFKEYNTSPSSVLINVPTTRDPIHPSVNVRGLIVGDPSFSVQNKWGPIINDISNLTDYSSAVGDASLFSWVSASTMCWKGTTPLILGFDFMVINYSSGVATSNRNNLGALVSLASLSPDPDAKDSDFKVQVHGGYGADVFKGNRSIFNNWDKIQEEYRASEATRVFFEEGARGSVTVKFGNKMTIHNLLLSKIDVTESTVEVADQSGGNINPLYFRVSVSFTGIKPLISKDVKNMFNMTSYIQS